MATDDADATEPGEGTDAGGTSAGVPATRSQSSVAVGEYSWADFLREHGHEDVVTTLYPEGESGETDWEAVDLDPVDVLGFHPDDVEARLARAAGSKAEYVDRRRSMQMDPTQVPVTKDLYGWEEFKHEYYYEDGEAPTSGGDIVPFDSEEYLGFDGAKVEGRLADVGNVGEHLADIVDERTVETHGDMDPGDAAALSDVDPEDIAEFDEDEFFSTEEGYTTLVNRYDLEKSVPQSKKSHFREVYRYWVNKPYSFVVIFHSVKENEKKYYAIEPHLNEIEGDLKDFLEGKLRNAIKYSDDDVVVEGAEEDRRDVIERETRRLLRRYDLYSGEDGPGLMEQLKGMLGMDVGVPEKSEGGYEGLNVRPEPTVIAEDPDAVKEHQVEKLLYYLKRDFIGYERIDPIKHDTMNVEDISADGYNAPVFVYHSDYEQIITNIYHGEQQLDDFVIKLAQRSGKGISKRRPQVDATLPDGSRSQLTLGREVSDHGTNYTIRQFKEVPFTPIDQISWNTMSLEEVAYLWLAIENHKSMIIAGGTATGKTTLLNALSLFIPSNAKIVSIEDTREVELPQRNWVASVTRPSFGEDDSGDVDEFDLLEAALRQRPDYIVMGEVRGEEGRDLFQVMSTGHTSYSTFHADSVGEVLKRFTTDPINVSKTMFTALDLVAIQSRTRVDGHSVVRNNNLTEINHYDAENDEINVQDVYQWQAETDEFLKRGQSNTMQSIMFDRGWSHDRLQDELFKREAILAYLINNGLNTYTEVAATVQAFINDPETILTLIANDQLERSLEDLREMESVLIEVDEEQEEMAPRPDPDDATEQQCLDILDRARDSLLEEYRGEEPSGLGGAIQGPEDELPEPASEVVAVPEEEEEIEFTGEVSDDAIDEGTFEVEEDVAADEGAAEETPALESGGGDDPFDAGGEPAEASADAGTESDSGDDAGPEWLFGGDEEDDEDDAFSFAEGDDDAGTDEAAASSEGGEEDGGLAFGDVEAPDDGASEGDGASEDDGETGAEDDGGLAFGDDGDDGVADGDDDAFAFGDDGEEASSGDGEGDGGLAFGDDGEDGGDGETDDAFAFGDDGDDADDGGDGETDDAFAFGDGGEETEEDGGDDAFAFGDGGQVAEEAPDDGGDSAFAEDDDGGDGE